ncbi:MAG: DUF418 domain-containing protein [Caulobacteraceae bacterium]|nr:DUF418 domain-containing protein [Caulobacteraceae bacterium]
MTDATAAIAPEVQPALKTGPVSRADRIETLDILRGFAVLGILAVNAIAFAWPGMMEANSPAAPYDLNTGNSWAIWAVEVLLHNKCRTLFSMLFGVSIFLVGGERSDRARGAILRRRLLVLAVFGLIHGLALWFGDILLLYAWSGLFMMLCRSWSPKRLLWTGIGIVTAFTLLEVGSAVFSALQPYDAARAATKMAEHAAATLKTITEVRSGWAGAMFENLKMWAIVQLASGLGYVFPTVGLMMIGLGLFKTGYLAGRSSAWVYGLMVVVGIAITVPFGWYDWLTLTSSHTPAEIAIPRAILNGLAPFCTLAYVGLLVLMTRYGFGWLTRRLAPVGKMAFTNYLTQTLIMTSLFYMPWGPLLYGKVEPAPLWGIVGGIWLLQLIWSPLWLSVFEMGPLEWVWRSLTYGRLVPLLKQR